MIGAIIFSNNSPSSLDTFLQSVKDNDITLFDFSVLYKSDELNELEYLSVFDKHGLKTHIKESNFKENLLNLIITEQNHLITFFKDTNYFFSKLPSGNIENIMEDQDIFCFSLCLGRNIKYCYYNSVDNVLLNETENGDNTIKWNWVKHYLDFGRPLELGGGHIFHIKEIFKMFKKWSYNDLQGLEGSFDQLDYYPKEHMSSFKNSILVDVLQKNYGTDQGTFITEPLKSFDFKTLDRIIIEI